mgnify:CR=1 FL=1
MSLELGTMSVDDLEQVLDIENRVHSHPWQRSAFETRLRLGDQCWVARTQGQLVAYAIISVVSVDAELLNISVDPRWQRRGIARTLLSAQIASIETLAENLFLEVRVSNHSAIALYGDLDFIEVGRRHKYYPGPKGREDALIMARVL